MLPSPKLATGLEKISWFKALFEGLLTTHALLASGDSGIGPQGIHNALQIPMVKPYLMGTLLARPVH